MPKPLVLRKKTGPEEETVTVIEYAPEPSELTPTEPLRLGLGARDSCGDGTEEFVSNNPLVIWKALPVTYYITETIPQALRAAIRDSFNTFNAELGKALYQEVTSQGSAKIVVSISKIDVAGNTLAVASWSYNTSTKAITKASIKFDSSEAWGALTQQSCGSNGKIFDMCSVSVHEVGHLSSLGHAPTDRLQTMYPRIQPGSTLYRSLGNGDKKGFHKAYGGTVTPPAPGPTPAPTPAPGPTPCQPIPCPPSMYFDMKLCKCVPAEPTPQPRPTPSPVPTTGHIFTLAEQIQLKVLRLQYTNAQKSGDQKAIVRTREELQQYMVEKLTEKHT